LEQADELIGNVSDDLRDVLDRLTLALAGRDPVVSDLAREVRFRYFDEPVINAARERAYEEMRAHISALGADPERSDRQTLMAALVDCAWPLAPRLTAAMHDAPAAARRLLVEA